MDRKSLTDLELRLIQDKLKHSLNGKW